MEVNVSSYARFGAVNAEVLHRFFTSLDFGRPFLSNIAGRWVNFRLLSVCTVLCFRFYTCLSTGFCNVPCAFTSGILPLAFPAFKEVEETTVWGRGEVSESETINHLY